MSQNRMEAVVEIDENERYWVGGGFGRGGLLPNDRGAFSSTDGSLSWKSTQAASEDLLLLGRGWVYEQQQQEDFTPATNWMYASDFRAESLKNAKPDRAMSSFVRFRRLYRTKVFNPDEFVPREISQQCSHVDSVATESLSNILLDVLAYCTLLHNPSQLTDAKALPVKHRIIDVAAAYRPTPISSSDVPSSEEQPNALETLDLLKRKLENFVEEERGKTIMNRLVKSVEFSFHQRLVRKEFQDRQRAVSVHCFPQKERDAISSLIIKKLDPHYQLHCDRPDCGEECRFLRVVCPHEGCSIQVSQMHLANHVASCPYKIVDCECGDHLPLKEMENHKAQACPLRDVECPLKDIGCIKVTKARDLQAHLQEDMTSHLLLAMNRVMEHQKVICSLNTKVLALESENKELQQAMITRDTETKKLISQLETKLTKTSKDLIRLEKSFKQQPRTLR